MVFSMNRLLEPYETTGQEKQVGEDLYAVLECARFVGTLLRPSFPI